MSKKELISRWRKSANKNFKTAQDLIKLKHYDWALFIGQLSLEKFLKGLVVKNSNKLPPLIHNLNKLAELAEIKLTKEQENDFVEISKFHIQARYDDIKYELYKTATEKYTKKWFNKIQKYYQWLKKLY